MYTPITFSGSKHSAVRADEAARCRTKERARLPQRKGWQYRPRDQGADGNVWLLFRSKNQVTFGNRSAGIFRSNQLWELNSSPVGILLADGKCYTLIGGINVGTRRGRLKLAKTSSAQGVCSLLRRMLVAFGVPETIKIDNGADSRRPFRPLRGTKKHPKINNDFTTKIRQAPIRPPSKISVICAKCQTPHRFTGTWKRDIAGHRWI